jgi:hypothetical protein
MTDVKYEVPESVLSILDSIFRSYLLQTRRGKQYGNPNEVTNDCSFNYNVLNEFNALQINVV